MKLRSPKAKFRVNLHFSKALTGIGSVDSFNSDQEVTKEHPYIQRSKRMAEKSGASLIVAVYNNKRSYPEFDWVEVSRFKA